MVLIDSAKELLKAELSVWSQGKSQEDRNFAKIHPAVMPVGIAKKILELTLTAPVSEKWVLDPMVGVGSVPVAALRVGANSIGIDINDDYIREAKQRVAQEYALYDFMAGMKRPISELIAGDSRNLAAMAQGKKFDVCVTSPPYFAIMHGKQTFTTGVERPYSENKDDLGNIFEYNEFLANLKSIYSKVYDLLEPGGWLVPVVGDANILPSNFSEEVWKRVSKENDHHLYFPVHVDVTNILREIGFRIHGTVDWDRRQDYNYLHSIGWTKESSTRWFLTIRVSEYIIFARK